ncbi:MAG: glycosyltransferase, partial [Nitrospirae bacterium]
MKLSVIIPVKDRRTLIENLLENLYRQGPLPEDWEVIIVDDCSSEVISDVVHRYGCRYVKLQSPSGASRARNTGAKVSRGKILFFTDSDCSIDRTFLLRLIRRLEALGRGYILGGTYRARPLDRGFFSEFQSLFIHYSETRHAPQVDYIATHAMAIHREDFFALGGFREDHLPMIEDVEFSHRARKMGMSLVMDPALQVGHHFGFGLWGSLKNAFRKAHYWSIYSLMNGDLLEDSGTASRPLKFTVLSAWITMFMVTVLALKGLFLSLPLVLASLVYS